MVECTNSGNSRGVFQRLEQTGMSDHYGLWHSHDSAPQMQLYIGLAEEQKKRCRMPGRTSDSGGPNSIASARQWRL